MTPPLNATHDATRRSWVEPASDPAGDFPLQNLPLDIFGTGAQPAPRVGIAIGDQVLDLAAALLLAAVLGVTPALLCAAPESTSKGDLSAVGPAQAEPEKAKLKAEVAAMEDAFCAMAQTHGLLAAFQHFAAPDVAFIDTDPRQWRGPAAVLKRIGPDQPGAKLTWSASFTEVSDDGTLGYNYGRYEWRGPGADGQERIGTGWFLTIWKRQPDGSWKYVMDHGAPDRPAPAKAAPVTEKKN